MNGRMNGWMDIRANGVVCVVNLIVRQRVNIHISERPPDPRPPQPVAGVCGILVASITVDIRQSRERHRAALYGVVHPRLYEFPFEVCYEILASGTTADSYPITVGLEGNVARDVRRYGFKRYTKGLSYLQTI